MLAVRLGLIGVLEVLEGGQGGQWQGGIAGDRALRGAGAGLQAAQPAARAQL